MYSNIGKKIKGFATVVCFIEIIMMIIWGCVLIVNDDDTIPIALGIIFGGSFIAWISSWVLYGFGELIDKVCDIERNTRNEGSNGALKQGQIVERSDKINHLHAQGLISEEEYQQLFSGNRGGV